MTVLPVSFKGQFPSLQLSKGVYVYFGWSGLERITGFSQFLVMLRWKHISSASCHVVIVHKVQGSVISRVFAGIFSNLEGLSEMSTCGLTRSLQVVHHVGSYCVTSCRCLVLVVHHVGSCGGAWPEEQMSCALGSVEIGENSKFEMAMLHSQIRTPWNSKND